MINHRLDESCIDDITLLLKEADYPLNELVDRNLKPYLKGFAPSFSMSQMYGIYENGKLVSIMTVSFMEIFPHKDSPNGRVCHISGAFTHPEYRLRGYASKLLSSIEKDAIIFGADYLCLDSSCDELYLKLGFDYSSESRLWKKI